MSVNLDWQQALEHGPFGERLQGGCAVINNRLWLFGGSNAAATIKYNDLWSTDDGVNWTLEGTAPWVERSGFSVCEHNGRVYLSGGTTVAPVFLGDVWSTSDGLNWVQEAAAAWPGRHEHMMVSHSGSLWVMAGFNGGYLNDTYRSDDGGVNWTLVNAASFATGRREGAAVSFGGYIWYVGGDDAGAPYLADIYRTTDGVAWNNVGLGAWGERREHRLLVTKNGTEVLLIGGYMQAGLGYRNDTWRTSDMINWEEISVDNPYPGRSDECLATFNNNIYIISGRGFDLAPVAYDDVYRSFYPVCFFLFVY